MGEWVTRVFVVMWPLWHVNVMCYETTELSERDRLRLCMQRECWGEPWLARVVTLDQGSFWRGEVGKTNLARREEADGADLRWCDQPSLPYQRGLPSNTNPTCT